MSLEAFYEIFNPVWTIVVFALFVGILLWAFSKHNQSAFDEASRLPFDDDDEGSIKSPQEKKHA
ncbi:MAG: Cbb3-type cytochrome oxidase component FixQ [Pseudomonadota bacterium]|jgi:cytochrome c oxidase cbb3-type subunit 4